MVKYELYAVPRGFKQAAYLDHLIRLSFNSHECIVVYEKNEDF